MERNSLTVKESFVQFLIENEFRKIEGFPRNETEKTENFDVYENEDLSFALYDECVVNREGNIDLSNVSYIGDGMNYFKQNDRKTEIKYTESDNISTLKQDIELNKKEIDDRNLWKKKAEEFFQKNTVDLDVTFYLNYK